MNLLTVDNTKGRMEKKNMKIFTESAPRTFLLFDFPLIELQAPVRRFGGFR